MKKGLLTFCLVLCLTALGGCAFRQVDELYTLPKLPGDYQNLQAKIEEVTSLPGAEYSAPLRGNNTQPVQFQDLDGDGTLEAIAFFKVTGDEKPLKIYIFRLTESGYEVGAVVEGKDAAIYSIVYENLNNSKSKELVVSWQKAPEMNTLAVYSIDKYEVNELLSTDYTAYSLTDMNMDNQQEIMVINVDTVGGRSLVDCYAADQAGLVLVGTAPLSQGIIGLDADYTTRKGNLLGETPVPALFVTSGIGKPEENAIVTDIFAWEDDTIKNVTLSAETGVSTSTRRPKDKARATDINGDNVMELPVPVGQRPLTPEGNALQALDNWFQYDTQGNAKRVCTTYHSFEDGWYFILPDQWVEQVSVIQDSAGVDEKRVVFYVWRDGRAEAFLTIYKLTGPNRHTRARLGERFTLVPGDTTIYCAEFTGEGWASGLDENGVKDRFTLSQAEW